MFHKNGVILHACVYGWRKEFFQRVATSGFVQKFFFDAVGKSVCNPVIPPAPTSVLRSVFSVFIDMRSAECVSSYYGLRVCS